MQLADVLCSRYFVSSAHRAAPAAYKADHQDDKTNSVVGYPAKLFLWPTELFLLLVERFL
jgi:hypothetical protein